MAEYIEIDHEPKYPSSMYYTLLFKKNGNLVAVGMINKTINYIPIKLYESKYKRLFSELMQKYLDHCIENGKTSIEYDTIEEAYTEIKEFRKNPYTVDVYFVDIDAMDDNNEDKYEEMIRSIIHKYVTDSYYYSTDGEVKDLRARKPYGSSLSNGHGSYTIKRKDEQEWIDSLLKK
jgi:hypothetical protein